VREWLAAKGIGTAFIEPASPWENACSESFNSRFRDEVLDREPFTSLLEVRTINSIVATTTDLPQPLLLREWELDWADAAPIINRLSLRAPTY
jgi:hypothetical protein